MEDELRNYANVAAHDLRGPVMAATYFLQLLARHLDDGRTERHVAGERGRGVGRTDRDR
jgi:light-regulated signal transduction histidine kinase (bacteriophytochrome)